MDVDVDIRSRSRHKLPAIAWISYQISAESAEIGHEWIFIMIFVKKTKQTILLSDGSGFDGKMVNWLHLRFIEF